MSCFWDTLIKTINSEDKNTYFNTILNVPLNPHNFVIILKEINKLTENILWNNEELTEKQKIENKAAIDEYDVNTINNGYYCSTFEPFLFLLVEYLKIEVEHKYNDNMIFYRNKIETRYKIVINSDSGHCWC
mgnify:CR=1 FL=1|tara:strand:+ start:78 stop:473 length:396 start_codon:yes stop_codon:yes gene_type:complete